MSNEYPEKKKVLITVKTYPQPSIKHRETVCTAGVLEDGSWIRLYPIPFRYVEKAFKFSKYQWIEFETRKSPKDNRPESFNPNMRTARIISDVIEPGKFWEQRRDIVFKKGTQTMCELWDTKRTECSLGIVKPQTVEDFKAVPTNPKWTGRARVASEQLWFDGPTKELAKIPFIFRYKYKCHSPTCRGHNQMVEDWEAGMLYLNMLKQYSPEKAAEMVRVKYLDQMCAPNRDPYFFVGRHSSKNAWCILGTFYPKKIPATQLKFNF